MTSLLNGDAILTDNVIRLARHGYSSPPAPTLALLDVVEGLAARRIAPLEQLAPWRELRSGMTADRRIAEGS